MITAIDMHAHYYGGLVEPLSRRTTRPYVSFDELGRPVLNAMTASTFMGPGYTDLATRLAWMDEARIRTQLLTFPGALGLDVMPVTEVGSIIHGFNDRLAQICKASAGRFEGLGGLPLADPDLAATELHRLRRELGLKGAILPGNYFLEIATAEQLGPVLEAANATASLLMVHPGMMPGQSPPSAYADTSILRASALNLQASLSHMGLTLVAGGFLERYPDLNFQLVNLGGTLPFVLERLEAVALSRPPHTAFPRASLRRLVYDCASMGPRALELAVKVLGADRIMLGTDYPIFTMGQVAETVEAADLDHGARHQILSANAERLLG